MSPTLEETGYGTWKIHDDGTETIEGSPLVLIQPIDSDGNTEGGKAFHLWSDFDLDAPVSTPDTPSRNNRSIPVGSFEMAETMTFRIKVSQIASPPGFPFSVTNFQYGNEFPMRAQIQWLHALKNRLVKVTSTKHNRIIRGLVTNVRITDDGSIDEITTVNVTVQENVSAQSEAEGIGLGTISVLRSDPGLSPLYDESGEFGWFPEAGELACVNTKAAISPAEEYKFVQEVQAVKKWLVDSFTRTAVAHSWHGVIYKGTDMRTTQVDVTAEMTKLVLSLTPITVEHPSIRLIGLKLKKDGIPPEHPVFADIAYFVAVRNHFVTLIENGTITQEQYKLQTATATVQPRRIRGRIQSSRTTGGALAPGLYIRGDAYSAHPPPARTDVLRGC